MDHEEQIETACHNRKGLSGMVNICILLDIYGTLNIYMFMKNEPHSRSDIKQISENLNVQAMFFYHLPLNKNKSKKIPISFPNSEKE